MKKIIIAVAISTIVLSLLGAGMLFGAINFFPTLMEEYFSPVFRPAGQEDWLFYAHPLILSIALKWFWERYKSIFRGSLIVRALEVALVYGIVALLPVLWLTFSAIDISFAMMLTWLVYGLVQSFAAGIVFAKLNP
jgi:hypothetical protein